MRDSENTQDTTLFCGRANWQDIWKDVAKGAPLGPDPSECSLFWLLIYLKVYSKAAFTKMFCGTLGSEIPLGTV